MWQELRLNEADEAAVERLAVLVAEVGTGSSWSAERLHTAVETVMLPTAASLVTVEGAEALFAISLDAANPVVRVALLDVVAEWLPYPLAIETLLQHIRDPDDSVCLKAIMIAGRERVEEAIPYFEQIVGWPSEKAVRPGKPVGMGAAHLLIAFAGILGTDDNTQAERLRLTFQRTGRVSRSGTVEIPTWPLEKPSDTREMVAIPGGRYRLGLEASEIPECKLEWCDGTPSYEVVQPPFLIDRYPVTASAYDRFSDEVAAAGHIHCHPLEPHGKDHTRNTRWDPRFGSEHPATGLDWFDAIAFARWVGKDLPTEYQWEISARGPESKHFPWGDKWDPRACTWVIDAVGEEPTTLPQWRRLLNGFSANYPPRTTSAVDAHDDKRSSFGVCDLIGNAWEWTKTDHHTGLALCPGLAELFDRPVSAVLKGGSWSSIPSMLYPSYRGRDALFCRHSEIGFRCVKNMTYSGQRQLGAAGRENRVIG